MVKCLELCLHTYHTWVYYYWYGLSIRLCEQRGHIHDNPQGGREPHLPESASIHGPAPRFQVKALKHRHFPFPIPKKACRQSTKTSQILSNASDDKEKGRCPSHTLDPRIPASSSRVLTWPIPQRPPEDRGWTLGYQACEELP